MDLRPYQKTAVEAVLAAWLRGCRRVALVAPTGSGKTRMGQELVERVVRHGHRVVWVAHRDELILQARERLGAGLGVPCGVIAAGYPADPDAKVQVSSVQTLLARGEHQPARLVVLDECHHFAADEWGRVAKHYATQGVLGLTATPERSDGRPLSDIMDELVVAASYSELVAEGHLVPCKVFRPREALRGLAKTPAEAYLAHGEGGQAFVFSATIEDAERHRDQFRAAGLTAELIDQSTPHNLRRQYLADFRAGTLRVLTNVYVLTEGVDCPAAQVCILARGVGHVSPYLQMVGRVLRPAPGKAHGILIDLKGASYEHGFPTADRDYSLGEGITLSRKGVALRVCTACGMTFPSGPVCPRCGEVLKAPRQRERVLGRDLVAAQPTATAKEKQAELSRLLREGEKRGWSLGFVSMEYMKKFGERPDLSQVDAGAKQADYQRLLRMAAMKGFNPGWAKHRFRARYGHFP